MTTRNDLTCEDVCRILESVRGIPVARLKFRNFEVEFYQPTGWDLPGPTFPSSEPGSEVSAAEACQPQLPQGPYTVPTKTEDQVTKEEAAEEDELSELMISDPMAFEDRIAKRDDS